MYWIYICIHMLYIICRHTIGSIILLILLSLMKSLNKLDYWSPNFLNGDIPHSAQRKVWRLNPSNPTFCLWYPPLFCENHEELTEVLQTMNMNIPPPYIRIAPKADRTTTSDIIRLQTHARFKLLHSFGCLFHMICTIYFHCGKPASVPRIGGFVQVLVHREGVSSWHGRWEAIQMDFMGILIYLKWWFFPEIFWYFFIRF